MKIKRLLVLSVVLGLLAGGFGIVAAQEAKKININTATQEELEALPGIGPKYAQAIIAGRPYEKVEDLLKVKGIGEKTLEKLKDLVEVKATKINVNTATLQELQTLPSIDPKLAQGIIDGRPYEKLEDLLKVKGIGDKTLEKLKDLVEVKATKINVNTATLQELQTLPSIDPKLAQGIIDGRPYEKVEDLLNVKGIGEKTLEKIKALVEVTSVEVTSAKIDVNSATLEELQKLPGISETQARGIIEGRPYEKVEDLLKVKGIGEKTLEKIKALVAVKPIEKKK